MLTLRSTHWWWLHPLPSLSLKRAEPAAGACFRYSLLAPPTGAASDRR